MSFLILFFFFDKNISFTKIIYPKYFKLFSFFYLTILMKYLPLYCQSFSLYFQSIFQLKLLLHSRTKHIFICRCELRLPYLMLYVVFETTTRCLSVYQFARNKTFVSNHPLVFLCLPTKMSDQKKRKTLNV
jgi:hypothetical protein